MKVSVLIPTFRYARYLPEAIESVLAQDFGDFEVIVSDDASNDGSAEVIRRFAARDPRIRFKLHESNLGMVANWNWCLKEARGEYIKYVFGDDRLMAPHALRRMVEALDADPGVSLVATARVILDADSKPVEIWDDIVTPGRLDGAAVFAECLRRTRNIVGEPSAVMFRRADGARGFDPRWRQFVDMEMWFHLFLKGGLFYEPEALCAFRRHSAQQTVVNQLNDVGATECMQIVVRYIDFFAGRIGLYQTAFGLRKSMFRYIYYTEKIEDLSPGDREAVAILRRRLTRPWYPVFWALHRVSKPLENLVRFCRKRIRSRTAPTTSSTLIRRTQ